MAALIVLVPEKLELRSCLETICDFARIRKPGRRMMTEHQGDHIGLWLYHAESLSQKQPAWSLIPAAPTLEEGRGQSEHSQLCPLTEIERLMPKGAFWKNIALELCRELVVRLHRLEQCLRRNGVS